MSYESFLDEYGFTEDYVQSIVHNSHDQTPMPEGFNFLVKESNIHGLGAFAPTNIDQYSLIAPARICGRRTPAGRYVNHSETPNAQYFRLPNGDLDLISTFSIEKDEEITVNYRQALDVSNQTIFNFPKVIEGMGLNAGKFNHNEKVELIEWYLLQNYDNEGLNWPLRHFVNGGVYVRELTIPAGSIVTGKSHNFDHICSLVQGDITVMTDDGMKRLSAPITMNCKAGVKRIGYAHTETIWQSIHSVEETDIEEIEKKLFQETNISWVDELMGGDLCLV